MGGVICSIAYQLTNVSSLYNASRGWNRNEKHFQTSPQENFALYMYMILFETCMITQIAIPCYFGNEIILKHESLTGSIFKCGWHLQSGRYRSIVIILMELVKKKRNILVGNLVVLDLNLFVSVSANKWVNFSRMTLTFWF